MKNRNEIDPASQWRLSDIYSTREDWEAAFSRLTEETAALPQLQGTLSVSPEGLKAGLDRIYAVTKALERLYAYASLMKHGDNGDPEAQLLEGRVSGLLTEYSAALSFVDPEILSIPEDTLSGWLEFPALKGYRHIIEDTARMRPYTLPAEQERALSLLGDAAGAPENTFGMLLRVDMTFPDVIDAEGNPAPLTHGSYGIYRDSPVRAVRKDAFEKYHGEVRRYLHTFAAAYNGQVQMDAYYTRLRGYGSTMERKMFLSNVPTSVYSSLVSAVHEALPTMERYLALRKQVLGLDELHMYDLYCPIVDEAELRLTPEESMTLVKEALAPLGSDYAAMLDRAFREQWMDLYENRGKTTGAFSYGVYGVHPFVLLNFTGTLYDAFTMAHELGHAMHSHYSSANNDFANSEYHLVVAEVASIVNEMLLTRHLLAKSSDPRQRAGLLNRLLESFRTTVFRQTLFAEFEEQAHALCAKGVPLTAEQLNAIYHSLNEQYYRGAVVDELMDVEWARIPHFYTSFYVYQYATGLCAAAAIADSILTTGDASGYLKFLTTGGSDYPLEELKLAGVDLTRPDVVRQALRVFDETLSELEALLPTL